MHCYLVAVWPRVAAANTKVASHCLAILFFLWPSRCLAEAGKVVAVFVVVVCYLVAVWSRVANKKTNRY